MHTLLRECRKRVLYFVHRACVMHDDSLAERLCGRVDVFHLRFSGGILRIDEHAHGCRIRQHLAQELHAFAGKRINEEGRAGDVGFRPVEGLHEPEPHRVAADTENDRDRFRCSLRCPRRIRTLHCDDHGYAPLHELRCERRQPIELTLGAPKVERKIPSVDVAGLFEPVEHGIDQTGLAVRAAEDADHRGPLLGL